MRTKMEQVARWAYFRLCAFARRFPSVAWGGSFGALAGLIFLVAFGGIGIAALGDAFGLVLLLIPLFAVAGIVIARWGRVELTARKAAAETASRSGQKVADT